MSYQKEREAFVARMMKEGVPLAVILGTLRDASTLQRLAVVACNDESADRDRVRCPEKYRQNGTCLCRDYGAFDDNAPEGKQHGRIPRYTVKDRETGERVVKRLAPFGIVADLSGDPRGSVVKITKPADPDWRGDSWGDSRDLCVPTREY